ncbi:phage major capsid protein [Streptomyces sp. NBC_00687]|uniref:phage major capsid protein n=1 Tax=Streptomyces sp. NBC_00687 TaxID=2975807 RepID=UPI0022595E71|nr:phage major capsid protein [Streptomyces sp. NBC_00687]MCX4912813.1 phage major capsid protein [Streptomyces sp. NBC_00687]
MYNDSDRIVEFPALKQAQEKLDEKRKGLAAVFTEAGPDYDMTKVKSLSGDTTAKVEEVRKMNAEIIDCKSKVDELLIVARAAAAAQQDDQGKEGGDGTRGSKSGREPERKGGRGYVDLGREFADSTAFKGYKPGSGMGPSAHLDISLKTLMETPVGWDSEDLRTGRVELMATRPSVHVAAYFPHTTTGMSAVVYMEETTYTNNAAETAEANAADSQGAYPESALALTERQEPVRKIATFLPVTDEQFEDEPRAQGYVNNRLPFMIQQRLDSQLLVGNGTAPNLRGTENVSGIQTQALGTDSIPDAVYKCARKIRDNGFAEPSVLFIAPAKWESVRLLKTADGQYIWGHPSMVGPFTIWGIPVVETTAVSATKAILGDYANFSELAMRRGIDVQVSNSHSDYFVKGKLAIRADMRAAAIHYRPKAFGSVTGL